MPKTEQYKAWHVILQPNAQTNTGGLWLGDYSAALDKRSISMNNIKTVITAATGLKVTYPKDIEHRIFHLYDCETEKISRFFDEAFTIISEGLEKGNVYVHCFAGISRSSTIVISYLMKKYGWSLAEAYSLTKKKRKYVDPNPGFMRELRRYEKQLKNSTCQITEPTNTKVIQSNTKVEQNKQTVLLAQKSSFVDGFRNYKGNKRYASSKENLKPYSSPVREVKQIESKQRPRSILMQDLNKIYLTKSKKGPSAEKNNAYLPHITNTINRYL